MVKKTSKQMELNMYLILRKLYLTEETEMNETINTSPNDNVKYCQDGIFSLMFMDAIS